MRFSYFVIAICFHYLPRIFALDTENDCGFCNPPELDICGSFHVVYERNKLAAYNYPDSMWINVLFKNVTFDLINGKYESKKEFLNISISTNVEGILLLEKDNNSDKIITTECKLDFKKNIIYYSEEKVSIIKQEKMIDLAHHCLEVCVCNAIGVIELDDYIRGSNVSYDFGELSVLYKAYTEKFYTLSAPYLQNTNVDESTEKMTINFIADFMVSSAITQLSEKKIGIIKLPDIKKDASIADVLFQNGTLRGLMTIERVEDVKLISEGFLFLLKLSYKIPRLYVHYDVEVKALYMKKKLNVVMNDFYIDLSVSVSYNQIPSKVEVPDLNIDVKDYSYDFSFDDTVSEKFDKEHEEFEEHIRNFFKQNQSIFSRSKRSFSGVLKEVGSVVLESSKIIKFIGASLKEYIMQIIKEKILNKIKEMLNECDFEKFRPQLF